MPGDEGTRPGSGEEPEMPDGTPQRAERLTQESAASGGSPMSRRLRRYAPLAVGLAVVLVASGTAVALRGALQGEASGTPAKLHLLTHHGSSAEGAAVARAGQAAPVPSSSPAELRLEITLPDEPDSAPVRQVSAAPVDRKAVMGLARALGLSGAEPQQRGDRWVVEGDEEQRLTVGAGDDTAWHYQRVAPDCAEAGGSVPESPRVEKGGGGDRSKSSGESAGSAGSAGSSDSATGTSSPRKMATACARAFKRQPAVAAPPDSSTDLAVPAKRARRVASPVFQAVGLDQRRATLDGTMNGVDVSVDPKIAGLPSEGAETSVVVGEAGIRRARGQLLRTERGQGYPLISARKAYHSLPPAPGHITDARLGVSLQHERSDGRLLVPAWIFTVERPDGQARQVARLAVHPDYLADTSQGLPTAASSRARPDLPDATAVPGQEQVAPPQPPSARPQPGKGNSGGQPQDRPPWPGEGRPMTGRWAEAGPGGREVTVHFFGSPESPAECRTDYTTSVDEQRELVTIRIEEEDAGDSSGQGRACPAVAAERTVTVTLERKLGDRKLVKLPEKERIPVRGR